MSPPHSIPSKKGPRRQAGILGGGQLAQMLAAAAKPLGIETVVHAAQSREPAAYTADHLVHGPLTQPEVISQVFSASEWVAIESELIDPQVLDALTRSEWASRMRPQPAVIRRISDKLAQKVGVAALGVATLPWEVLPLNGAGEGKGAGEGAGEAKLFLERLKIRFPQGYVLKWARGGYDGHGVLKVAHPEQGDFVTIMDFIARGHAKGGAVYAERLCPFKAELALVATRTARGDQVTYPVVLTTQDRGICAEVRGPAHVWGVSQEALKSAESAVRHIGAGFDLIGTFAVEFFLSEDGAVLVNEVAPRVHNSGHFSQDAAQTSQFENHWRALFDLPLGPVTSAPYFAMLNILGPEGYEGPLPPPTLSPDRTGSGGLSTRSVLHWYQKETSRPRRKMGHVNILAESETDLTGRLDQIRRELQDWARRVSSLQSYRGEHP